MTALSIVVPCYNEEAVLQETNKRLLSLLDQLLEQEKISTDSRIYFVDDGSDDRTWALIEEQAEHDSRIHGIRLSRNWGHQNALLAGLLTVDGDAVVSVDADLQDDISVIENMVDAYHDGKDVIYGVRKERDTDALFKRGTAEIYYNLLKWTGVDVVFNHADYRLMSRRALEILKEYNEVNLFLRGIIPTIGFPSSVVTYNRNERFSGESKYTLRKMLALAINGITSFSTFPLRMIAVLGIIIFLFSLMISAWVLWVRFISGDAVPGWASSVLPMYFLGGIQLFSIGVVGEYVGKIYMESKRRPRFVIEEII
jgi:glycosyltransferase involved in cell wall biosynthesis